MTGRLRRRGPGRRTRGSPACSGTPRFGGSREKGCCSRLGGASTTAVPSRCRGVASERGGRGGEGGPRRRLEEPVAGFGGGMGEWLRVKTCQVFEVFASHVPRVGCDAAGSASFDQPARCPGGRLYAQPHPRLHRLDRLNRGYRRVGRNLKSSGNSGNIGGG